MRMTKRLKQLVWLIVGEGVAHENSTLLEIANEELPCSYTGWDAYSEEELDFVQGWVSKKLGGE